MLTKLATASRKDTSSIVASITVTTWRILVARSLMIFTSSLDFLACQSLLILSSLITLAH